MSRRDHDLKPYGVRWRPDLTTGWLFISFCDEHGDAQDEAERAIKKYGGQSQVITQHVIETLPGQHRVGKRAKNYKELIEHDNRLASRP